MRRKRRTKEEWKATLEAQKASGLTAPEYCAKYKIHLQTFYARKSDILKPWPKPDPKAWVKVTKDKSLSTAQSPQLTLQYQGVVINVLHSPEPSWLTEVVKGLAS
jgi:hypothetical protein